MKKALTVIFLIALIFAGYYFLRNYYEGQKREILEYVPGNTIAVYESEYPVQVWNKFLDLPVWSNLSSIPEIGKFNSDLQRLDTITGASGNLDRLMQGRKLLLSLHKISNTKFDIIFYLTLNSLEKRHIINEIFNHFRKDEHTRFGQRIFDGKTIKEITFEGDRKIFSYIQVRDYFIGSFTPFLIEDVIRNINSDFRSNFKVLNNEIFRIKPIEKDQGDLYLNLNRIPKFIRCFTASSSTHQYGDLIKWLAKSAYYDVSFEGNRIFFNGSVSIPTDNKEYFLPTFYNQAPQPIEAIHYAPGLTGTLLSYTYDDFTSWRKAVDAFWEKNYPQYLQQKIRFFQQYEIYEKNFYQWIGKEIDLATLQSIDTGNPDKILMIRTSDTNNGLKALDDLTLFVNHVNEDTLLFEEYGDKIIKQLNIPEFPEKLLGSEFKGFENSYYTAVDNFIMIGNSFDVIKMLMDDLADENTWGKSVQFVRYFDNVQKKANVSLLVNFSNDWNSFYSSLNQQWHQYIQKYDREFKHFELFSFQFSNVNNNFYTSAALQHRQQTSLIKTPEEFLREQVVITDNPIARRPFIVRNHLDRSLEIIVQDTANQLYLISKNGEVLWKDSIGDRIRGDLYQVDFYANNKLQYLFATSTGLHIIDRNGDYISGYPVKFDQPLDVQWVNVIDYDNSKRYRILIAESGGNIYMFDKYGQKLEGWDPKKLEGGYSSAPLHIRIRGRDCIVAVQEKGEIQSFHRDGTSYDGFPVKFDYGINSPVFIRSGTNLGRTNLHTIIENGVLININLLGKIADRMQLYRPGKESRFEIVPDVLNKTYVICRQDFNKVVVLRKDGESIFEKELLYSGNLAIQYYNFSADNEVFAFTDKQQGFTYLFDANGSLINNRPVESGFKIGLIYSEVTNTYKLYSCYGNQFSVSSFYRR